MIHKLKAVNGDKSLFRQWRHMFTTPLQQFKELYEEIAHKMAREVDLGKEVDAVISMLYSVYGEELREASADVWRVLLEKAEAEAFDNIKMIPQGEGIKPYGVVHR